jgi:tetratricopeptide (TPR) repeat protein
MKRTRAGITVLLACAVIAMTLQPVSALAATCEKWAGKVVSAQGVVEAKPAGETQWQPVKLNETYCPGDTIRTDRKSRADIALSNHPILRLDQNSTVTLGGMKDEKTSLVDMISGAALFFSRVTRNLEVRTATVNAGVEGTEFFIRVEEGKTDLTVFEGKVLASNAAGGLPVTTGQSAVAEAGKAPVYRVVVRPRDAVQWALYYPPVLDGRPPDLKEDSNDPRFYTTRASQLLAVGRVDEAIADIDKAQKLDPKNSDAFALQAMIAVTQNEKGKALELARKAAESDPKSATARIALSYAQQAHFDLQGALSSLEEAVKLAPGNALAWARLAELQQSFGYLEKSLDSAKKAVASNPDLSRTQTVLGFSHLTRIETKEARGAFEKAIKLDDADPLPRLGLGLATIRDGSLEEGRREIEIAMSLDPNSSLIRSYLGKAYFEEKRDKLATGQYEMAKSMDPSDPTPYFYDAIEKQTTNRPIEALQDMEKAIQLNDNRAVYRSRLLLDQDVASREASLARIYSDLGFQQRALVEGWSSLNYDPSNYSAHRFLADTYSALPRHEIARVSELLQAQLLQPINISPIQPNLAESNLLVVAGGGPSGLSFNEFNPLFERNRMALQANGIVGEQNTWGDDLAVSGIYDKASISLGQYHYQTEGFRENNDLKDNIYNAFLQYSFSPKTSLQAEYRYRETNNNDPQLRFFPDDYYKTYQEKQKSPSIRLGFHHSFNPGSDLLISYMHKKYNNEFNLTPPGDPIVTGFGVKAEQESDGIEAHHIYRSKNINLVSGIGYFLVKTDQVITTDLLIPIDPPLELQDVQETSEKVHHLNLYAYSYLNYIKNVTFTVGASFDSYSTTSDIYSDKNQFNPKFGITWNPVPDTTLRAAAFKVLKRTLVTSQTLEPTQVAGFNQFYDDQPGTESWRYGIGADQKFSRSVYGGAEFTYRDLTVPYTLVDINVDPPAISESKADWKEKIARAYLYWTPHNWFALNASFSYEKIEREDQFNIGVKNLKTQRIPLGASFFHPSGLNAMLRATFVDQNGEFNRLDAPAGVFVSGSDQFWLVDAAISYRLPQRYGFFTVGANNLFDKQFKYYDTDIFNPTIQPQRMFYAKITLSI